MSTTLSSLIIGVGDTDYGIDWALCRQSKARTDSYGHILAWPDGSSYRVLVPGALRAMFSERRVDVSVRFLKVG